MIFGAKHKGSWSERRRESWKRGGGGGGGRKDRPQPESRKRNQRTLEKGPFPLGRVRRKEIEESKKEEEESGKHFLSLPPLVCFPLPPPPPLFYDPSVSLSSPPSTGVTLYPWHGVKTGRWGMGVAPPCELRIFSFLYFFGGDDFRSSNAYVCPQSQATLCNNANAPSWSLLLLRQGQ